MPKYKNQPCDYYHFEKSPNEPKRGEIISILSMEIGESEGLSQSYHHQEDRINEFKVDSKTSLRKVLGLDKFENQKTLKQNINYLKNQIDIDNEPLFPPPDNLKVVNCRPVESRHVKHRKVEYRERLEEEKGHKKAKSHRSNKYQYIRNNHDIITKHQRHKSSDSTENDILLRSNGFEILYKKGEKLEKMLNHYETEESKSDYDQEYTVKDASDPDESSSISEIGKIYIS